jgi:hypothetical protein
MAILNSVCAIRLVVVDVENAVSETFCVPLVSEVLASSSVISGFIVSPPLPSPIPKHFMHSFALEAHIWYNLRLSTNPVIGHAVASTDSVIALNRNV